jgi:hypothetical protein
MSNLGTSAISRNGDLAQNVSVEFVNNETGDVSTWIFETYRQAENYFAVKHDTLTVLSVNGERV